MSVFACSDQWRSQPENLVGAKKIGGTKMLEANNTILFGKSPLKAQNDYTF